jgi:hypothetical protein
MVIDPPFKHMDAVEQRLRLLQQQRDQHASHLRLHLDVLKDHDLRGRLMKEAVRDMWQAWKPAELVRTALEPAAGIVPLLVQFATIRGGFKRRLLLTALSVAAPALLKRMDLAKVMGTVMSLFRARHEANGKMHAETVFDEADDPLGI